MAIITGTKIKFVYVPAGTTKPEPAVDGAVYFIEDTKEIHVGDRLIASAGLNVVTAGTGEDVRNVEYDSASRTLTVTKGNLGDKYATKAELEALRQLIEDIEIPEYTIAEGNPEAGLAKTYELRKDGVKVGASINIPKDLVVSSGAVRVVDTADVPYEGAQVGDKYVDLELNDPASDHIYIPVKDLVDVYTAGTGITISDGNVVAIDEDHINSMIDAKALSWNVVTPATP